jgi:hypothetical protein
MMARALRIALVVASALVACSSQPPPSVFLPTSSFQDIMAQVVDPAADGLWDSVGTITTTAGQEELAPHSDADWAVLRGHAVRLVEASNLLLIEGRPIVAAGLRVEDAHVPGINSATEIAQAIAADRPRFVAAAHRLHAAASAALSAVERHDAQQLMVAGDALDKACEACHATYWYPAAAAPPPVGPARRP